MNLNNEELVKVVNIDNVNESKQIVAMNQKFKTICFVFDEGKGIS